MGSRFSSRWAWELFEEKGWEVTGGEVWDATDFVSWRYRTAVLLGELFPADGAESALDRCLAASSGAEVGGGSGRGGRAEG